MKRVLSLVVIFTVLTSNLCLYTFTASSTLISYSVGSSSISQFTNANGVNQDGNIALYRASNGVLWGVLGRSTQSMTVWKGTKVEDLTYQYDMNLNFLVGRAGFSFNGVRYPDGPYSRGQIWLQGLYIDGNGKFYCYFHNETGWSANGTGYNLFGNNENEPDFRHIGLMTSTDNGLNWNFDSWVITSNENSYSDLYIPDQHNYSNPQVGPMYCLGAGDQSIFVNPNDNYIYTFYSMIYTNSTQTNIEDYIYVARAAKSNPKVFYKYYNGTWSEAGNRGEETPILGPNASIPSVVYSSYLSKYVLISTNRIKWIEGKCSAQISISSDLVNWSAPVSLVTSDPTTSVPYWSAFSPASTGNIKSVGNVVALYYNDFGNDIRKLDLTINETPSYINNLASTFTADVNVNWWDEGKNLALAVNEGYNSGYSMKMGPTEATGEHMFSEVLFNTPGMKANTDYTLKMMVKKVGSIYGFNISTQNGAAKLTHYSDTAASDWTAVNATFNSGSEGFSNIGIQTQIVSRAGYVLVDKISLTETAIPGIELYPYNGDFETGIYANITGKKPAGLQIDTSNAVHMIDKGYNDNSSLLFYSQSAAHNGWAYTVVGNLPAGSYVVKLKGRGSAWEGGNLWVKSLATQQMVWLFSAYPSGSADWTEMSGEITIPENDGLQFYANYSGSAGKWYNIDDIQIFKKNGTQIDTSKNYFLNGNFQYSERLLGDYTYTGSTKVPYWNRYVYYDAQNPAYDGYESQYTNAIRPVNEGISGKAVMLGNEAKPSAPIIYRNIKNIENGSYKVTFKAIRSGYWSTGHLLAAAENGTAQNIPLAYGNIPYYVPITYEATVSVANNNLDIQIFGGYIPAGNFLIVDDVVVYKEDDLSKTNVLSNGDFELSNGVPQVNALSVETNENTSVDFQVIATDEQEDTLTYTIKTQPSNGQITGTGNSFTFTPSAGFVGNDSAVVTVSDGIVSVDSTISINVLQVPAATFDYSVSNDDIITVVTENMNETLFLAGVHLSSTATASITNKTGNNVGTGAVLTITKGSVVKSYTILLKGDTNGDGDVAVADLAVIKQRLLQSITLDAIHQMSADLNSDTRISISDLLSLKKLLLGLI